MTSLGAKIMSAILRLYTYPYRKNHKSLSRSIKLKNTQYKPPRHCRYEVKNVCGTNIEILSPMRANTQIAIVHFHGGGHTQSMNKTYRKVVERLCDICDCPIYSIDYKTGGDLVYPSVHNECFLAYSGLLENILKNTRIIAIGDSFGANLMLSTCLRLRDKNMPLPHALICISCYVDLAATGDSYEKNCYSDPLYSLPKRQNFKDNEKFIRRKTPYCGETSPFDPLLSPAYAEYHGFPNMLIQCGDRETSESDSDTLYKKALEAEIKVKLTKYKDMWHDFQYLTPFLKESKLAWKEIAEFIKSL